MFDLRVKPILDSAQGEKIMKEAREDGHLVIQPTHFVSKNEQTIGAFNLNKLPASVFWMHSKLAHAKDSLITIEVAENIARARGDSILMLLTKPESPFHKLLGKIGYTQLDTVILNYKLL